MSNGQVILVSGTVTQILPSNQFRLNSIVRNVGSITFYVGGTTGILASGTNGGLPMNPNDVLNDDGSGRRGYLGPIYGFIASGTSNSIASYWERSVQ
jgi:hypothetical protein